MKLISNALKLVSLGHASISLYEKVNKVAIRKAKENKNLPEKTITTLPDFIFIDIHVIDDYLAKIREYNRSRFKEDKIKILYLYALPHRRYCIDEQKQIFVNL